MRPLEVQAPAGRGAKVTAAVARDGTVTLIRPPNIFSREEPPLGVAYVAAFLERAGFADRVNILDCEALRLSSDQAVAAALKERRTAVAGVSFFTYDRFAARRLAALAKSLGIVTVAGGVHVSTDTVGTMQACQEFDYGVVGEGEVTFAELVKLLFEGGSPESIAGLAWRDSEGSIRVNEARRLIEDLDSLPPPAYHLLPMSLYASHAVLGSRGCPSTCKFCASPQFWQRRLRFRSPESVVAEVCSLLRDYGEKPVHFKDDTFTCNPRWAIGVCSGLLSKGLRLRWDLLARATGLREEVLGAAREAGADKIRMGVESGNEAVRELIEKRLKTEDIHRAIALARSAGFASIGTFFMIGLPGETEKEVAETYDLVGQLDANYVSFKPADIYPGTGMYEMAIANGTLPASFDWFAPDSARRLPRGFLVYEGVPTYTHHFSREGIQELAWRLYLDYFAEKLFRRGSEPDRTFFKEMGFMGVSHYRPAASLARLFHEYFRSPDSRRRRLGLYQAFSMATERLLRPRRAA